MSAGGVDASPAEHTAPTVILLRFSYLGGVWAALAGVLILVVGVSSLGFVVVVSAIPVALITFVVGIPFGLLAGVGALLGPRFSARRRLLGSALGSALLVAVGAVVLLATTGLLQPYALGWLIVVVAAGILSPLTIRWIDCRVVPRDLSGAWLIVGGIAAAAVALWAGAIMLSLTRHGAIDGGCDDVSSSYFPPQVTCVVDGGQAVELIPRTALLGAATLAFAAIALLTLGLTYLWRSRNEAFIAGTLVPVSTVALCFAMAILGVQLVSGAVGPVAEVPHTPNQSGVVEGPWSTGSPPPNGHYTPVPFPPTSTVFTAVELQEAMQSLHDRTIAAAVPIGDVTNPPVVLSDDCDDFGLTVLTRFASDGSRDTLARVRDLWAAEGYTIQPTADYAVRATGGGSLPAAALVLQEVAGELELSMQSVCVLEAP